RCASPIGALPPDGRIARAIRREHDALAIGRPDWKSIVPFERELTRRGRTGHIVDPDVVSLPISDDDSDSLAIGGYAWDAIRRAPHSQQLAVAFAIEQCQTLTRCGFWQVHERSAVRHAELCRRCGTSSHSLDDGYRIPNEAPALWIEPYADQRTTLGVDDVPCLEVSGIRTRLDECGVFAGLERDHHDTGVVHRIGAGICRVS